MTYLVISSEKTPQVISVRGRWASFHTTCYHELFVDDLKDAIPVTDRFYRDQTWSVHEIHLDTLMALVAEHWGEPTIEEAL